MKLFILSLVAACALMVAFATSAFAGTDSNFPEITTPGTGTACTEVGGSPATSTGSATGFANKMDLFVDACLGGP